MKKNKILIILVIFLNIFLFNVFAEEKKTEISIPVSCIGENTNEVFEFNLEAKDISSNFKIVKNKLNLANRQEDSFVLEFYQVGDYSFTIKQVKGSDNQTAYDETIYIADVHVFLEDEDLFGVLVLHKENSNDKTDTILFKNTKVIPTAPKNENTNNTPNNSKNTGVVDDTYIWTSIIIISVLACFVILYFKKGVKNED